MSAVFPFPLLSVALAACWLALAGVSTPNLILALVLAFVIPRLIAPALGAPLRVRSAGAAMRLAGVVAWDIVLANIAVARLVLGPVARLRPGFVRVPLDVTQPSAIALFASIVSIVPGSVCMALTPDARTLLVHVLDLEDEDRFVTMLKERYERPLLEILEC